MFYYPLGEETELRMLEERHAHPLFTLTDANRSSLREWLNIYSMLREAWVNELTV